MIRTALVFLFLVAAFAPAAAGAAERVTVFAAASLKDVMGRAVPAFEAQTGGEVVVSLAGSSVLARQIDAGAPADVFISADMEWMDWLEERGKIENESRRVVAGNDLVIAARDAEPGSGDPAGLLASRFAMGDPTHVPAGRYAKAALSSLGLWKEVKDGAVLGENVRVALELARRGEVKAAIVYGSDQKAVDGLARAYTFPGESHPPIRYPAAMIAGGKTGARAFLDFLSGDSGRAIFADFGFMPAKGVRE